MILFIKGLTYIGFTVPKIQSLIQRNLLATVYLLSKKYKIIKQFISLSISITTMNFHIFFTKSNKFNITFK